MFDKKKKNRLVNLFYFQCLGYSYPRNVSKLFNRFLAGSGCGGGSSFSISISGARFSVVGLYVSALFVAGFSRCRFKYFETPNPKRKHNSTNKSKRSADGKVKKNWFFNDNFLNDRFNAVSVN